MIKLQITRFEKNENYEKDLENYKNYSRNSFEPRMDLNKDYPRTEISKDILDVYITEEQFDAIRKATLEVF